MKKLISILLTVTMLLSLCVVAIPASAEETKKATVAADHVPGDFNGDGKTDSDAIAIDTMDELKGMQGKKGYLTKDFVVKMSDANPATDTNNAFTIAGGWPGADTYLDGCGYTIEFDKTVEKGGAATPVALFNGTAGTIHVKNLNLTGVINAESDTHVAPLCKHGGKGDVENVVIDVDITVKSIGDNGAISGAWGKVDGSQPITMKNVHFIGSIEVKCAVTNTGYNGVGGLLGHNRGIATFDGCSNEGVITANESADTNGNIGGIIGYSSGTVEMTETSNSGAITVKANNPCVGGLIGKAECKVDLLDCENSGAVSVTSVVEAYGHNGIGGFIGAIMGGNSVSKIGSIKGCTNKGAVSIAHSDSTKNIGNVYVGGIVGRMYQTVGFNFDDCSNEAAITNHGTAGAGWGSVGGIVGTFITITNLTQSPTTIQVKDCDNSGAITGMAGVGGVIGSVKQFNNENRGTGNINFNILGCKNVANITGTESEGSVATAGIVGDISAEPNSGVPSDSTMKLTVSDCLNIGNVIGKGWHAGGVIGRYFWPEAASAATVEHCVNVGDVKLDRAATKEDPWLDAAGIIAQATGGSDIVIKDCINAGAISTAEATGMSTYPITNCVNTVVSGGTITSDIAAYVTASGNVYTADSVLRADANYHKFSEEATKLEIAAKISAIVSFTSAEKAAAIKSMMTVSDAYATAYMTYCDAVAYRAAMAATDYTTASVQTFDSAIALAYAVLFGAENPADADVTAAAADVESAKAGLMLLNRDALEAAIAAAGELVEAEYSVEDWAEIEAALTAANAAMTATSQSDIDAAASALNSVITGKTKLDTTALEELMASCDLFSEEYFTADSWSALVAALADAQAAIASRSQVAIDTATEALDEAIYGLVDIEEGDADDENTEDEGANDNTDNGEAGDSATNDSSKDTTAATDSSNTDEEAEQKSGCGSAIAASSVALVAVLALGFGLKKKED